MTRRALGKGLEAIFANLGTEVADPKTGSPVQEVELRLIAPNPFQPRHEFAAGELQELRDSIVQKGLLQPILLRKHEAGYQIVAGERRFRAFQQLKRSHIPALVRDRISDRDMTEMALVENVQRVPLNPIEEAEAYEKLAETGLKHEDIGARTGKSRSAVTNALRLLKLEPEVRQWLQEGRLSPGHGRALLQSAGREQLKRARAILEAGLNVRAAERQKKAAAKASDPNARALLEELRQLLGLRVSLRGGPRKGVIQIYYNNRDDINNMMQTLRARAPAP